VTELAAETVRSVFSGRVRIGLYAAANQPHRVRVADGVIVTGAFTGAVFTAQTFFNLPAEHGVRGRPGHIGRDVPGAGPVLTGLMVAGRVGAAMSAELGTMKVTQQIDARGRWPCIRSTICRAARAGDDHLGAAARGECIFFGILAGYLVATEDPRRGSAYYMMNMISSPTRTTFSWGSSRLVFAVIIVFISCREGLHARDGAVGVGRATTEAVVIGSLSVLIANFFLTMLSHFLSGGSELMSAI